MSDGAEPRYGNLALSMEEICAWIQRCRDAKADGTQPEQTHAAVFDMAVDVADGLVFAVNILRGENARLKAEAARLVAVEKDRDYWRDTARELEEANLFLVGDLITAKGASRDQHPRAPHSAAAAARDAGGAASPPGA